ncbi:DUF2127 domain-containing protein [Derxia lacustris]|uniref:DUF2127 domain-containing protein n=1 Tax=Derxia lacustris TaxID=764842 RepID=UPI000A16EA2D|nr:DUF2127 domain-containing protein [Derxia lacustris]
MSFSPTPVAAPRPAGDRALRSIAAFEALKGLLALAAGLGLLGLLHRDLHALALALIGHLGLDPDARLPALLLHDADALRAANPRALMQLVLGYVLLRGFEAWGLWQGRAWGELLGALSGALYLPFELAHLLHRVTPLGLGVIALNLAVLLLLGWRLWRRRGRSA